MSTSGGVGGRGPRGPLLPDCNIARGPLGKTRAGREALLECDAYLSRRVSYKGTGTNG